MPVSHRKRKDLNFFVAAVTNLFYKGDVKDDNYSYI